MCLKKCILNILVLLSLESGNGFISNGGAPTVGLEYRYGLRLPLLGHQRQCKDKHNLVRSNHVSVSISRSHVAAYTSRTSAVLPLRLSVLSSETLEALLSDAHVQASLLDDMSNILLQTATIFDPSVFVLRLAVAVSRILAVYADYLPNRGIAPDSLFFDSLGLLTAYFRFRRSAELFWLGSLEATTINDEKVYEHLFEPAGLTWRQFKTLKATSMEWVDVPPNTTLICEDDVRLFQNLTTGPETEPGPGGQDRIEDGKQEYIYWLYQGGVELVFRGNQCYKIDRTSGVSLDDPGSIGLMGDMRFICRFDLQSKRLNELKKHKLDYFLYKCGNTQRLSSYYTVDLTYINGEYDNYLWATYKTGNSGATLLRINTDECLKMLDDDDDLATSFRLLLMKSLQRKVTALLKSQHEKEQNKVE